MRLTKHIKYFFFITALSGCTFDDEYIAQRSWKHSDGFKLIDTLSFDQLSWKHFDSSLADSTVATIEGRNKSILNGRNELRITAISTGEEGVYYECGPKVKDHFKIEIILADPPPIDENPPPPRPQ